MVVVVVAVMVAVAVRVSGLEEVTRLSSRQFKHNLIALRSLVLRYVDYIYNCLAVCCTKSRCTYRIKFFF